MSFSHFFKHLPGKLSHCLTNPRYASPLTLLSALSFTNYKPRNQPTPTSLFKDFSTSSSSSCCNSLPSTDIPSTESFTPPSYLSVRIRCQKHDLDMLSEALLCFGASSTSVDEEEEEDGCQSSDEICIDSIFPECQDVDACISQAADSIGLKEIPSYEVKIGAQHDWINKYQESFLPVEVTKGLWIVPEWTTPPDVGATNIILNPGLAFGTGDHPTTNLCLLLLHRLIKGGEFFLDYGTGSGILAIAAIKFGAALSVGIDIDPQAITSALHNAALNNIGPEKMKLQIVPDKTCPPFTDESADGTVNDQRSYHTEVISEIEKYDVVIANILLNPLLELADHIVSYAKPGAVVAISGVLSEQLPYIMDRYSTLLEGISVTEIDDWACVSGTKKANRTGS